MHFRPRFWAFRNFLGLLRFLWNLWVGVYEIAITCSCIAYSLHYNYVSCILGECAWLLMWVLIGLDWVFPMMLLIFARHMFMQTFFLFFPIRSICRVSFYSLSLSLLDRLCYGTQTAQIYSISKPSSRFRVIFFFYSSHTLSFSVPWWEGQDGFLWELPSLWSSSRTLGHSVRFLRHYTTRCHLDLGMGISLWETRVLSCCVYSGVLVQHTWNRYLCASVCIYIQRYTYHSYSGSYIWGTTHP